MISLSVIIPTTGRADFLKDALESITKQTLDQNMFEVIVVENGNKDHTEQVVKEYQSQIKNLLYVFEPLFGLHRGRHVGYMTSRADILVYADDDIVAFPTWLEGIYESFQDDSVVLVGGKCLPKYEGNVPFWIQEMWYKMYHEGHCMTELSLLDLGDEIQEVSPYYIFGCNYSIRKYILDETHGFHPDGMPFNLIQYRGDGEMYVNRYIETRGYRVLYNPKAGVFHRVPQSRLTLDYFKKRAFCQGIDFSYKEKRYHIKTMMAPLRPNNLYQKILFKIQEVIRINKMTDIEKEISKSLLLGYNYHQYMFEHDNELRAWVEKDNYLD